jgi:endogenous inhibitor of DNA gyrase (YacG/DUF329 family)
MRSTIEQQGQREPREKAAPKGCPVCAKPVPVGRTRPFIFCSHACRQKAWDLERQAGSLADRAVSAQKRAAEAQAAWAVVLARKQANR